MQPTEIQIGKKYIGKNGSIRKVIEISEIKRPERIYHHIVRNKLKRGQAVEGPGIVYEYNGIRQIEYLVKFADWAVEETNTRF